MSLLWRRRRELHPDQIRAIEGLSVDGRYLLLGPPGSGKTSILLHRGQYLRLPPHNMSNVRLVTFTRTLREFIAVSGDDRDKLAECSSKCYKANIGHVVWRQSQVLPTMQQNTSFS